MKFSLTKKFSPVGKSGMPYWNPLTDEYKTLLASVSQKPSKAVQQAQDKFLWRLKGNNTDSRNTLAKLVGLIPYCLGMPVASDSLFWWDNPTRKATLSVVPPTYVSGQGWTGNGSSSYINSTFNPSVDGGTKYTRNDASAGWMFMNDRRTAQTSGSGISPSSGASGAVIFPVYDVNTSYFRINNAYEAVTGGNISTQHLFTLVRKSSTLVNVWRDRVPLASNITKSSVALDNLQSYTLACNDAGSVLADSYQTDTVGLEFHGSQLDQTDLNVICDALDEALMSIASATPLLSYSADGLVISADWTVTNPNADVAEFIQNDAIVMRSLAATNANVMANNIKSVINPLWGAWSASLVDIEPPGGSGALTFNRALRLWLIDNDTVGIERSINQDAVNLIFTVRKGGTVVYSVSTGETDTIRFKIIYSPTKSMSLWKWSNDAWVQVGVSYSASLFYGVIKLAMGTRGQALTETSLRDIYITQKSFNTVTP
jgi:hypothetical protein